MHYENGISPLSTWCQEFPGYLSTSLVFLRSMLRWQSSLRHFGQSNSVCSWGSELWVGGWVIPRNLQNKFVLKIEKCQQICKSFWFCFLHPSIKRSQLTVKNGRRWQPLECNPIYSSAYFSNVRISSQTQYTDVINPDIKCRVTKASCPNNESLVTKCPDSKQLLFYTSKSVHTFVRIPSVRTSKQSG